MKKEMTVSTRTMRRQPQRAEAAGWLNLTLNSCVEMGGHLYRPTTSFFENWKITNHAEIKKRSWIDLICIGSPRFWCRSIAEVASFSTTPKSSRTNVYNVDSWPHFDLIFSWFLTIFQNEDVRRSGHVINGNLGCTRRWRRRWRWVLGRCGGSRRGPWRSRRWIWQGRRARRQGNGRTRA